MGNSASALPYTIGKESHAANRPNSYGFSIHAGERKSDQQPVTVFKGEKSVMVKTPLTSAGTSSFASAGKHQSLQDPSTTQFLPALHHFKKCKTLIHPYILSVYATLDTDYPDKKDPTASRANAESLMESNPTSLLSTDKLLTTGDLIIVTEKVMPLEEYLNLLENDAEMTDSQRADCVAWGIYNLIQAVHFLHNTAKVSHGNLIPEAIYVTPGGDFKLFGFYILTPIGTISEASGSTVTGPTEHFRHFEQYVTPEQYRSPERKEGRYEAISTSPVHVMDSYSFGVLMSEIYRHLGAGTSSLLPNKLEKACMRLQTASLARPRILPLSKCPIFASKHVQAQKFMDEIATQSVEDKISFWKSLPDLFSQKVLCSRTIKHKVLPLLRRTVQTLTSVDVGMTQEISKRECLALLPTLFTTATIHLSKDEFQSHLEPIIEILFKVNDRAIRGAMLGKISMLVQYLDAPSLNRVVFEPMCSGFTDSSAPLRELTLKSAIVLVSYLTQPNLEKLTRYLVRLQSDPEDSIRTNTVIFIGKVAPSLSDIARSKLILPAFMRAMTDGFVPCRLAGLKAICASSSLFDEKKLASEVLPAIAPSLVDASSEVRDAAMKAVDDLLIVLRQYSETMRQEEAKQRSAAASASASHSSTNGGGTGFGNPVVDAAFSTSVPAPKSSSSSYLYGLSSWASSKLTSSAQATEVVNNASTNETSVQQNNMELAPGNGTDMKFEPMPNGHSSVSSFSNLNLRDAGAVGNASAGWSDDDFDDIDSKPKVNSNKVSKSLMNSFAADADDDFMSQFDSRATIRPRTTVSKSSKLQVPSSLAAGANRRQKEPIMTLRKEEKVKPSIRKLNLDDDPIGDGWDDF